MSQLHRRSFLIGAAIAGAASQLPAPGRARAEPAWTAAAPSQATPTPALDVPLRWLNAGAPPALVGTTWGVPWPRGALVRGQELALTTADDQAVPVQSWPTGFWPDGTVKWTAHAIGTDLPPTEEYLLRPGTPAAPPTPLRVTETARSIEVDTGVIRRRIARRGRVLIPSIARGDRAIAAKGTLVCLRKDAPEDRETATVRQERFTAEIGSVTVEQRGPVRAVVRVEGRHRADRALRQWLPFTIRLYLYAGSDGIRMMHTFVFDGNERKDFISGLGVRFQVPMTGQPHDRHIRFAGDGDGVLAEAVHGITGLRRDPGATVRQAQVAGRPTPDVATWDTRVSTRLPLVPRWGDYSLRQLSDGCFDIRKRTRAGHGWVQVDTGRRASGLGYVGGISGGFAFGMRDFWQLHPTQLDIRGAAEESAEVTVWLWSPEATPMDLRFYHDGMGMDTYPEQLEGLEITYEDYEPGFGSPYGVAAHHRAVLLGAAEHAECPTVRPARCGRSNPAAGRCPTGGAARGRRLRRLESGRPQHHGPPGDRGPTRLPRRLPPQPGGAAFLVRVLELRRHHAQLRPGPARVALRRRRVRVGQLRTLPGPVAVVPVPALRPGRRVPVRRGDDPAHR